MCRRKSSGPSTEPCGTPEFTGTGYDVIHCTATRWCLSFKNAAIQFSIGPFLPQKLSFPNIRWCETASKALEKSTELPCQFGCLDPYV